MICSALKPHSYWTRWVQYDEDSATILMTKKYACMYSYLDHLIVPPTDLVCQLLSREYETSNSEIIAVSWWPKIQSVAKVRNIISISIHISFLDWYCSLHNWTQDSSKVIFCFTWFSLSHVCWHVLLPGAEIIQYSVVFMAIYYMWQTPSALGSNLQDIRSGCFK